MCKVPFCHPQYNKKAVFLEFYCLLSIYFWGRVFDNLGGAGEQIKILGHLFTPGKFYLVHLKGYKNNKFYESI